MTGFWIVLGTAVAIFYAIPKVVRFVLSVRSELRRDQTLKAEALLRKEYNVKCYDGPCHGHVHQIVLEDRPKWYISPYVPTDDDGQPNADNIVGQLRDTVYIEPSLAYYQQVADEDYFYVRDISKNELQVLVESGILPTAERTE